jgi:hypothetical protein
VLAPTLAKLQKHIVFSDEFAENKRDQWNAFSRKLRDENAVAINQIVAIMRDFFFPVLHASQQGTVLKKKWKNKWRDQNCVESFSPQEVERESFLAITL